MCIRDSYTYQSPEYTTVLSGVNSNLNGDTGSAIDRTIINPNGMKGVGSKVYPVYSNNPTLVALCGTGVTQCSSDLVGYAAANTNAYYIEAGSGTAPNASRNTLPVSYTHLDVYKRQRSRRWCRS